MEHSNFGQTQLSVIALREAPKHSSEMVSQLLYNEPFTILEQQAEWSLVRCLHDDYQGWLPNNQIHYISQEVFDTPFQFYSSELINWNKDLGHYIFMGSPFRQLPVTSNLNKVDTVCQAALKFINCPYLWGGRSPMGIDCSGLMQVVTRLGGVLLPRDAWQQAAIGSTIEWGSHQKGNLAFFENIEDNSAHVGLVLGHNSILHASAYVRIDTLTKEGIFNNNIQTHQLSHFKRLF